MRPKPLMVIDWGERNRYLGPRFTEIGTDRHWWTRKAMWRDTDVGYILHYWDRGGKLIPFKWKTQKDLPHPPKKG